MVYAQDLKSCVAFAICGFESHSRHFCKQNCLMYKVYILKSRKDKNKTYVGLTIKPTKARLLEHNLDHGD